MYVVDGADQIVDIPEAPQSDVGAPLPAIVADEHHLLLAYLVSDPDPDWDGATVRVVSPETDREKVAVAIFARPYAHFSGPPNDEAFHGHPLARRGLKPYSAIEVLHSSWIRRLEQMNRVHPYHNPGQFLNGLRHFIFAFHDSTFECIAGSVSFEQIRGSIAEAMNQMVQRLRA